MVVYEICAVVPRDGRGAITKWAGTKGEATSIKIGLGLECEKDTHITTKKIVIPRGKKGLLWWLNSRFTCDNNTN